MKSKSLLSMLLMLFALTTMAEDLKVVTTPVDGGFTIAGQETADKAILLYDANDAEVVTQ